MKTSMSDFGSSGEGTGVREGTGIRSRQVATAAAVGFVAVSPVLVASASNLLGITTITFPITFPL